MQVYNRCIGTRFCQATAPTRCAASTSSATPTARNTRTSARMLVAAQQNPDVTVRGARRDGEVHLLRPAHQRARGARPRGENRPIARRRGRRPPASSACPTRAIVFGDLQPSRISRVAITPASRTHYALLGASRHPAAHDLPGRLMRNRNEPSRSRDDAIRRPRAGLVAGGSTPRDLAPETGDHGITAMRQRTRCCGRSGRAWWIALLASRGRCSGHARRHRLAVHRGHRHLGRQLHRRLGLRHRQLRLVDRHRQCRHADLLDAAADPAALARLDQPLRRGDDAVRRLPLPACSRSCISAGPICSTGWRPIRTRWQLWPQWRSALVWDFWAIAQLSAVLDDVLVRRPHSRSRDAARPCADGAWASCSMAPWPWAGAARPGTGSGSRAVYRAMAALARAAGRLGAQRRRPRFRRRA